jgi:hypothetical protein
VGDRGALALHDVLEVVDVGGARLIDRPARGAGHDDVSRHAAAQLRLGLGARQAVGETGAALQAKPALDAPPANPPRAVPGLATSRI